jgi:hypothetical protein
MTSMVWAQGNVQGTFHICAFTAWQVESNFPGLNLTLVRNASGLVNKIFQGRTRSRNLSLIDPFQSNIPGSFRMGDRSRPIIHLWYILHEIKSMSNFARPFLSPNPLTPFKESSSCTNVEYLTGFSTMRLTDCSRQIQEFCRQAPCGGIDNTHYVTTTILPFGFSPSFLWLGTAQKQKRAAIESLWH